MEFRSDETGHYITGFGISTKPADGYWSIDRETGHQIIPKFEGHHFAIIPELINTPIRLGGGGHYWGNDTLEDLLRGYERHSHGIITNLRGPFYYNDGTQDYRYDFDIKLRDSAAASALMEHGSNTWVPFSISPHIFHGPNARPPYKVWEPVGTALVIKGGFGPESVIRKLCTGTELQCKQSLAASTAQDNINSETIYVMDKQLQPCKLEDAKLAEIISSYVSKSASTKIDMPDKPADTTSTAPIVTELRASTPKVDVVETTNKSNPTVESQQSVTTGGRQTQKLYTPEEFEEVQKRLAKVEEDNTNLRNKDKLNTLNTLFAKVKDPNKKKELIEKYMKFENVDEIRDIIGEVYPVLRSSEEPENEDESEQEGEPRNEEGAQKASKTKTEKGSKAGSTRILTPDSSIPNQETGEGQSKAGSTTAAAPPNKAKEIADFINSGGRFY